MSPSNICSVSRSSGVDYIHYNVHDTMNSKYMCKLNINTLENICTIEYDSNNLNHSEKLFPNCYENRVMCSMSSNDSNNSIELTHSHIYETTNSTNNDQELDNITFCTELYVDSTNEQQSSTKTFYNTTEQKFTCDITNNSNFNINCKLMSTNKKRYDVHGTDTLL